MNHDVKMLRVASVRAHVVLLGLSGLMLGLAFPRPGWWWLGYVALAPAGVAAAGSGSVKRLGWTGWLVGWLWWLVMIRWMVPVTGLGYVLLAGYMGVYFAVFLWAARVVNRGLGLGMAWVLPVVWVSLELVRGSFLEGGFGWFALGHSQASFEEGMRAGRVVQVADLFGEQGVSFLVAMGSGVVVDGLTRPWFGRAGGGRSGRWSVVSGQWAAGVMAWVGLMVGAWVYGEWRLREREGLVIGPGVAVVQTNVAQDNKNYPTAEREAADWKRLVALTEGAGGGRPGADLIVWPETAVPAGLNEEAVAFYRRAETGSRGREAYHEKVGGLAKKLGMNLLVGASAYEGFEEVELGGGRYMTPGRRYNSAYLYRGDGERAGVRYDKVHRVPFGEYIPWVDGWPWAKGLFIEYISPYQFDYSLTAGVMEVVFEFEYWGGDAGVEAGGRGGGMQVARKARVATPICFEDVLGEATRGMVYGVDGKKKADLLVNLTNDGWFAGYDQPVQHAQIAAVRCVELRVPMVRCVNTGPSGFIGSDGKVEAVLSVGGRREGVDGWMGHRVRLDGRGTWFGWWGRRPAWVMAAVCGVMVGVGLRRLRRIGDKGTA